MEKLAGPVRGKNGAVLLYQATGTDMLEHRFRPKSLVLLKTSVEQIPVYIGNENSDLVSFKLFSKEIVLKSSFMAIPIVERNNAFVLFLFKLK